MKLINVLILLLIPVLSWSNSNCSKDLQAILRDLESRDVNIEFEENLKANRLGFMSAPAISTEGFRYPGIPEYKEMYYLDQATWSHESIKGAAIITSCQTKIIEKATQLAKQYNEMMVEYLNTKGETSAAP